MKNKVNRSKVSQSLDLFFLSIVTVLLISGTTLAQNMNQNGNQNDSMHVSRNDSLSQDSINQMVKDMQKNYKEQMKQYEEAMKEQKKVQKEYEEQQNSYGQQSGLFGVKLDVILGYTGSNSTYEGTSSFNGVQTNAKNGGFVGANVTLTLMGFQITTGLSYSSKGFKTSSGNAFDMNYINLPLMMSFNFNIGKKVLIEPSFGPYIGFGLSNSKADSSLKKIDIGITGSLQGTYMFQKHLGAVLGFKYEQGGLNNLSGTSSASVKTKTWCMYSGVRVVF